MHIERRHCMFDDDNRDEDDNDEIKILLTVFLTGASALLCIEGKFEGRPMELECQGTTSKSLLNVM